jgi:CBS domain-containing protein
MTDVMDAGSLPIRPLVAEEVARIAPDADLTAVARLLAEAEVGALVVSDGEIVKGVVSERDLVRAVASGRDLATTRAIDVAQTALVWCEVSCSVADVAEEMMEQYVRHVLVEDSGSLVGVVSARDLLGAYAIADLRDE